jgi:membrane protease YdiL (CAAX protease family)
VEFIEADSTVVLILFCLLGTFLVPLAQQLFFRDLQQRCMDAGSPCLGALLSSAIPALVLITFPLAALIMFLTELAACVLFQRTRHLLAPIVLSMVAGALGFGLLWHAEADTPKWGLQSQGQSSDALRQGLESLKR